MIGWKLYLIEILHQTTTLVRPALFQPVLYLIEILHQTTTRHERIGISTRCILSKFYIKPQHPFSSTAFCAVVSYRNSTSNHNNIAANDQTRVVVSYRNSTSNHNAGNGYPVAGLVVSYRNSTSNHNKPLYSYWVQQVVSYRNSTSNHNIIILRSVSIMLYLIEILHQTTTDDESVKNRPKLYLIEILHQTTTQSTVSRNAAGCILSKFYIKPQHYNFEKRINYVVSYRNSTSNHNDVRSNPLAVPVVSYRNSTSNHNVADDYVTSAKVVSYRNSTSNHNNPPFFLFGR